MIKDNLRIILLSGSDFSPGRALYISKALESLGLEVTMLTHEPIYQKGQTIHEDTDSLKATILKIKIPFAKALYSSLLGRLAVYTVFSLLAFIKLLKFLDSVDVVYSRGPHPFTDLLGIMLRKIRKNIKVISDITDLWPDAIEYLKLNTILKKLIISIGYRISYVICSRVNVIITHTSPLKKILQRRYNRPTYVIYGAIDLRRFRPMDKSECLRRLSRDLDNTILNEIANKCVVMYAGLLGPFQNPFLILELAKLMRSDDDILFLIVGTGPLEEDMKRKVKKLKLGNVVFLSPKPHEKMPFIYNLADLFVFTYASSKFLAMGLPKKIIEYAAIGKPILYLGPRCVASDLCLQWRAGYHIKPDKICKSVEIIRQLKDDQVLRNNIGINAREMAKSLFSINSVAKIIKDILSTA